MSNEEAKQQAIIKAWAGEGVIFSPLAEPALSENGHMFIKEDFDGELFDHDYNGCRANEVRIRPTSLRGIEDNLGWVKINPDGSNIPEEVAYYEVCINGIPWGHPQPLQFLVRTFYSPAKEQLTHFRKWEPSKPPIY